MLREQHRLPAKIGEHCRFIAAKVGKDAFVRRAGMLVARSKERAHRDRPHLLLVIDPAENHLTTAEAFHPIEEAVQRTMRSGHGLLASGQQSSRGASSATQRSAAGCGAPRTRSRRSWNNHIAERFVST